MPFNEDVTAVIKHSNALTQHTARHRTAQGKPHLSICSGGVSDVGAGRLAVATQAADQLGGVAVKVVAHIRQADLTAVQVLECDVHRLERTLKDLTALLTTSARPVLHANKTGVTLAQGSNTCLLYPSDASDE